MLHHFYGITIAVALPLQRFNVLAVACLSEGELKEVIQSFIERFKELVHVIQAADKASDVSFSAQQEYLNQHVSILLC